ncbi:MAG: ArsI/CadI family heavy metal resistance metalloenzyme [Acidobacteriota bacterium]|nr:ArsI/CadI family heavy metal resistance metalloenzyme [Acidobacteriota bacterium]
MSNLTSESQPGESQTPASNSVSTGPQVSAGEACLKVHVSLNVNDVQRSVEFYRAFFGAEPVKQYPGYAKFDVAEPPLNLALNEHPVKEPGALNHLGVQVPSSQVVKDAIQRLEAAGLMTLEEEGVDCCHALQDKVWAQDPDGYRWEVFAVLDGDTGPACDSSASKAAAGTACCV